MMMQLSIHSIALLIDRHHKPCILYYHKLQIADHHIQFLFLFNHTLTTLSEGC
jgi:hypothetical protein